MDPQDSISVLDVVALIEPLPELGLVRGEVGTVVEEVAPAVFEVEFSDDTGVTYAFTTLTAAQVMRLQYRRHDVA